MAVIKSKYFPFLLISSALLVEGCAAFFSVYGLTKLFSGASLAVGIMAGSLETAKIIAVSYLYRYWNELKLLFKTYLTSAIIILMFITSLGIYGFLSNAFQGSTLLLEKELAKITLQEDELKRIQGNNLLLISEKNELLKNQSQELDGLVIKEDSRYLDVNRRASVQKRYQQLIKEKDVVISENNRKIESLSNTIADAKIKVVDTGADVGPIIFIAKTFNVDITTVVQWIIVLFIIVFDPLALALIISFNTLVFGKDNRDDKEDSLLESNDDDDNDTHIQMNDSNTTPPTEEVASVNTSDNYVPPQQSVTYNTMPAPPHIKNLMKKYDPDPNGDGIVYVDTSKDTPPPHKHSGPTPVQTTSF